jgi:hypothetical protein
VASHWACRGPVRSVAINTTWLPTAISCPRTPIAVAATSAAGDPTAATVAGTTYAWCATLATTTARPLATRRPRRLHTSKPCSAGERGRTRHVPARLWAGGAASARHLPPRQVLLCKRMERRILPDATRGRRPRLTKWATGTARPRVMRRSVENMPCHTIQDTQCMHLHARVGE